MSAAEKLKALQERTDTGTALNYGRVAALNELEAVLPQIVAVVEAIPLTLKHFKEEMDAWDYAEYSGHKYTYEELAPELVAALSALDEALGDVT